MQIRIEATDLPGHSCGAGADVYVAVQRKNKPGDLLNPVIADAPSAEWTLDCTFTQTKDGRQIAGPYIQTGIGGRFIYLSWLKAAGESGGFTMFARSKLMLDAVGPDLVTAAEQAGVLIAKLGLTSAKGGPLVAAVRPPLIAWSAAPAG